MVQCCETPRIVGRENGNPGCNPREKRCGPEELGHGVQDAAEGLRLIELGIKDVEYFHPCEGAAEIRHGVVKVEKAIDELLGGLSGLETDGCKRSEGYDEFLLGVREMRHGAMCCCEGLGELAQPGCHGFSPIGLHRGAGEIRLGLAHVIHALRQLLGFDFPGGPIGGGFPIL